MGWGPGGLGSEILDPQRHILDPGSMCQNSPSFWICNTYSMVRYLCKRKYKTQNRDREIRITDADPPPPHTHLGAGVAGVEEVNAVAVHDGQSPLPEPQHLHSTTKQPTSLLHRE
jgi:hypothetical protein